LQNFGFPNLIAKVFAMYYYFCCNRALNIQLLDSSSFFFLSKISLDSIKLLRLHAQFPPPHHHHSKKKFRKGRNYSSYIFFLVCVVSPFIVAVDGTRSSQIEAAT